jgi:hypothetical protein
VEFVLEPQAHQLTIGLAQQVIHVVLVSDPLNLLFNYGHATEKLSMTF